MFLGVLRNLSFPFVIIFVCFSLFFTWNIKSSEMTGFWRLKKILMFPCQFLPKVLVLVRMSSGEFSVH